MIELLFSSPLDLPSDCIKVKCLGIVQRKEASQVEEAL